MKTIHIIFVLVFSNLSSVLADEPAALGSWPIASPIDAFRAVSGATRSAFLRVWLPAARPPLRISGGEAQPVLGGFFVRHADPGGGAGGERFDAFLDRVTKSPAVASSTAAGVTLCDRFGVVVRRFDFGVCGGVPAKLDCDLHAPGGVSLVPFDVPAGFLPRQVLARAPSGEPAIVLPDGTVVTQAELSVRQVSFRGGRIYFPWALVAADGGEVAVEAIASAQPGKPRRYLLARTSGRIAGRVEISDRAPSWWPDQARPLPVANVPE